MSSPFKDTFSIQSYRTILAIKTQRWRHADPILRSSTSVHRRCHNRNHPTAKGTTVILRSGFFS